jgi:DNA polymerase (family 10)
VNNSQVAEVLETVARIMEVLGENPFKVRAHSNAARTLRGESAPVSELVAEGTLGDLPGIGPALKEKITELVETGKLKSFDELKKSVPAGVLDMLRVPSLGPKKVHLLWKERKITTLKALESACRNEKLSPIKGFGKKTEEKILGGILFLQKHAGKFRLGDAWPRAMELLDFMRNCPEVDRAELAGSIRRSKEVVKDVDILASSKKPAAVMKHFLAAEGIDSVIAKGKTKSSVRLRNGLQVDLRVVKETEFASALAYFTGSKEHNVLLRGRAQKMGLKINEYGIFKGTRKLSTPDESAFYKHLGLAYVPPELREAAGEIEAAENDTLPDLIEPEDLAGIFHSHTTWSDGTASLEAMAEKARSMGLKYMGLSDHSKAAFYANGLDEVRLARQHEEVKKLNRKHRGFRIYHGMECDILPDGSLDLDDEWLKKLDFVIGSIHSRFDMSEEEMTARVCRAIAHPHLTIYGHATGRLLLNREPFRIDLHRVIQAAKEHGKVIELNANPNRLDLDWVWARKAKEAGVLLSINPDAHSTGGLEDIRYGVGTARRAWVEKKDVLNTRSGKALEKLLS